MSKCNVCGNEKILCSCPKRLGGNSSAESTGDPKDEAYEQAAMHVANALLKQYADIFEYSPSKLPEFISKLRTILADESAENILELLKDGVATASDRVTFLESFKSLNPNMAMLDALSREFALNVFPSPSNQLVETPREIPLAVRQKTLDILRERFKPAEINIISAVYLSEPARRNVLMRINLTSASESVPKSVILKQVLPQTGDVDDKHADARFARDWAGLEFASSVQEDASVHSTPLFYGSDAIQRFILIEDLGQPHISLVDSLLSADRDKAVSALERYMKTLGRFHATTFGHSDEYAAILKRINHKATTPEEDLAYTTEYLSQKLESNIHLLTLPLPEDFLDEVRQVLDSMLKPGPFTVLTHGDIAPDNVFDHEGIKGLQLIDFEACALRNALLDGSYLRMSIPTGWCAKTIPNDLLMHLENIYRTELEKTVPEASNDLAYSTAYTHACAYHVLDQVAHLDEILKHDKIWGGPLMPQYPLWDPTTNSSRSRFLSRLQAFVDVAAEHDRSHPGQPPILPNLRKMVEDMLNKVKAHWGENAKPLDFYPAFKQASLKPGCR